MLGGIDREEVKPSAAQNAALPSPPTSAHRSDTSDSDHLTPLRRGKLRPTAHLCS